MKSITVFGKGSVAAVLLSVFLISGTAWAVDEYTVFGSGRQSCGTWLSEIPTAQHGFHAWISGYLTAYSLWVERPGGPVSKTDNKGAWAWIDNYCRDNPLKNVADAAEQLILAIEAK